MWGSNDTKTFTTDAINIAAQELVHRSFTESTKRSLDFAFEEIPPPGSIGPSFYRAVFRGVQIVSFNCAVNWESYDQEQVYSSMEQFQQLADTLDRSMTTIFFQHYPIRFLPAPFESMVIDLLHEFNQSAVHLSGHVHRPSQRDYSGGGEGEYPFSDYVAPYPHSWPTDCSSCNDPGFYSLLVSPTQGILQVKQTNIPGLQDGETCQPFSTCRQCHSRVFFWPSVHEWRCGAEPEPTVGQGCWATSSCLECQNQRFSCPWYGLFIFFCRCV